MLKTVGFPSTRTGDQTIVNGNEVIATAGKGIDFSANANAPGMTSELLNWYEEGTWTPNQGTGLTVVGAFSATGKYTRIGRQVTVTARFAGATSISCAAFGQLCSNLPYTSGATSYSGAAWGGAGPTSNVCVCSYDVLYLIDAATAGSSIDITLTYFV